MFEQYVTNLSEALRENNAALLGGIALDIINHPDTKISPETAQIHTSERAVCGISMNRTNGTSRDIDVKLFGLYTTRL